jgi:hypothetical protein
MSKINAFCGCSEKLDFADVQKDWTLRKVQFI